MDTKSWELKLSQFIKLIDYRKGPTSGGSQGISLATLSHGRTQTQKRSSDKKRNKSTTNIGMSQGPLKSSQPQNLASEPSQSADGQIGDLPQHNSRSSSSALSILSYKHYRHNQVTCLTSLPPSPSPATPSPLLRTPSPPSPSPSTSPPSPCPAYLSTSSQPPSPRKKPSILFNPLWVFCKPHQLSHLLVIISDNIISSSSGP